MKLLRKLLVLTHRYLGIALSLLVIMWFASGIVMMYTGGMPVLTPQMRLDRVAEVDLSRIAFTAAEAAGRIGLEPASGRVVLLSLMDRPAYRFSGAEPITVFADTGQMADDLSVEESQGVASRFVDVPESHLQYVRTLTDVDQWTLGQSRQLPLHKFRVSDPGLTEVYVQPSTGEVTMLTTRRSRALAWVGTIPHWLYFAALRSNQPVWYRIVVWTSGLACVLAVLGLLLGVTQFRRTKPFRLAGSIPYSGWLRWHYVTGVIFGVFTLTWAFSGLLSMEPFAWTNATGLEVRGDAFTGGPVDLSRFRAIDPVTWGRVLEGRAVKEVTFARIQDEHYYVVRPADEQAASKRERLHQPYYVTGRAEPERLLVSASTFEVRREPFSVDSLLSRLKTAVPDVPITESQLLSDYDSYYYSRGRQAPLPVLRVKFGDPAETWVYIDPEMSQVLAEIHRLNRVERWLYNGLHSLDFAFWYDKRPLWDIGMITLLLGGLATSVLGFFMGVKRLRRATSRAPNPLAIEPHSALSPSSDVAAQSTNN